MSKKSKATPKRTEPETSGSAPIYAALKRLGISRIEVTYDGFGDSGCIEGFTAFDAQGKPIDLPNEQITIMRGQSNWDEAKQEWVGSFGPAEVALRTAVTDWCYDVLEERFPCWGNDDGACGTITIDVAKRLGQFEHHQRFIDTTSHEGSF